MAVKEWECAEHGCFERSHPICPAMGCESENVKQVFLTPPMIASGKLKRFDAGIRKSADMMGINNFRSARPGEAAYGGDEAKKRGLEMLWGDDVKRILGVDMGTLSAAAQQPLTVGNQTLTRNNGMREAATELGITRRTIPRAGEVTAHGSEAKISAKKASDMIGPVK